MGGWVRVFSNKYKGHMDKNKGMWKQGTEVGITGVCGGSGEC